MADEVKNEKEVQGLCQRPNRSVRAPWQQQRGSGGINISERDGEWFRLVAAGSLQRPPLSERAGEREGEGEGEGAILVKLSHCTT